MKLKHLTVIYYCVGSQGSRSAVAPIEYGGAEDFPLKFEETFQALKLQLAAKHGLKAEQIMVESHSLVSSLRDFD
jgi:hypothetical protein